jgi:hypothetical protein
MLLTHTCCPRLCHHQVLDSERAAKEALQAKLDQARAASERKGAMVRELQRKQEELQQRLAAALAADNTAKLEVGSWDSLPGWPVLLGI